MSRPKIMVPLRPLDKNEIHVGLHALGEAEGTARRLIHAIAESTLTTRDKEEVVARELKRINQLNRVRQYLERLYRKV